MRLSLAAALSAFAAWLGAEGLAGDWGRDMPDARPEVVDTVLWPNTVKETSGLARQGDLLWTINDSGDGPILYALPPTEGEVVRRVRLAGAENQDWEDLAQDARFLYVADCGNNKGKRRWMTLYRVSWQALRSAGSDGRVAAEAMRFAFADYAAENAGERSHNVDCEAIAAVEGELWVFSKNRGDQQTRLYRLDPQQKKQEIAPVATYPVGGLITAADYDSQRRMLVLLGYKASLVGQGFVWRVPVKERVPDWSGAEYFEFLPAGQWESVLWDRDGSLLLTTERSPLSATRLARLHLPPVVDRVAQ